MLTTRAAEPDVARAWRLAHSVTAMVPEFRKEFFRLNSNLLVSAVLARAGQKDSATRLADRSRGNAEISPTQDLALVGAFVQTLLADTTKALDLLKLYFSVNERDRAAYAEEPGWWFRPIAGDPRWRQLVGAQ
jgi:hypothetical protein